jgi:hypothetical protein
MRGPRLLSVILSPPNWMGNASGRACSAYSDEESSCTEDYFGESIARATARHMEYPYPDVDSRRIQL